MTPVCRFRRASVAIVLAVAIAMGASSASAVGVTEAFKYGYQAYS